MPMKVMLKTLWSMLPKRWTTTVSALVFYTWSIKFYNYWVQICSMMSNTACVGKECIEDQIFGGLAEVLGLGE